MKQRRRISNVLIIVGVVIFVFMTASVLLQDWHVWQNDINGFAHKYDSYADMVWSREKGDILICFAIGLLPAGIGFALRRHDPCS